MDTEEPVVVVGLGGGGVRRSALGMGGLLC